MLQREVEISNKLGLHARASAKLTQVAGQFGADVWLSRNGRRVNAKSIMGVMMLAAGKGSRIVIETDGADETRRCAALEELVDDKFGEDENDDGERWASLKSLRSKPRSARRRRELHAARHRRLGRHRDRPRAPHLACAARGRRTTRSPREDSTPRVARFDAAVEQVRGELDAACARPCPPTRRPSSARFIDVHLMILDDFDALGRAARDHPREPLQRRVGAGAQMESCSRSSTRSRTRTCASARRRAARSSSAC